MGNPLTPPSSHPPYPLDPAAVGPPRPYPRDFFLMAGTISVFTSTFRSNFRVKHSLLGSWGMKEGLGFCPQTHLLSHPPPSVQAGNHSREVNAGCPETDSISLALPGKSQEAAGLHPCVSSLLSS